MLQKLLQLTFFLKFYRNFSKIIGELLPELIILSIIHASIGGNSSKLKLTFEKQMTAYKIQLKEMLEEYNETKLDSLINAEDMKAIKSLYRKLARQLHPDISPLIQQNPELLELWERASVAYKCNDLKMLQETDSAPVFFVLPILHLQAMFCSCTALLK